MSTSAAIAVSLLRLKIDGKKLLRRDAIERGGTSKLGLAGRFAACPLNVLHEYASGSHGSACPSRYATSRFRDEPS